MIESYQFGVNIFTHLQLLNDFLYTERENITRCVYIMTKKPWKLSVLLHIRIQFRV